MTSAPTSHRALLAGLIAILIGLCAVASPAFAKKGDDDEKKRKQHTVGEWAYKRLTEAQEAISLEPPAYSDSLSALDRMKKKRGLNPHEIALMWQTYGWLYSEQEKYGEAQAAFENCIKQDALPLATQLTTLYNLGQLYMANEKYKDAIRVIKDWMGQVDNVGAQPYYLLAAAYLQMEDYAGALPYAKTAVDKVDDPREDWLQILMACYFEQGDFENLGKVLRTMVTRYPKKAYWIQLSAVYSELDQPQKSLAAMELAYRQGFLTKSSELRNLAEMYLYLEVPYQGAHVLKQGLADGSIEADWETWELLGNAWLNAREYDKALTPLERAAGMSGDGEIYIRIAQIHLEEESWGDAIDSLEQAINKGGLKNEGNAHLLLGIGHFNQQHFRSARVSFNKARQFDKTRRDAGKWLKHVDQEERARS